MRALIFALLLPLAAFAQTAASPGRMATLRLTGTLYTSAVTGVSTSGLTITSVAAATGSQDTAFTFNASTALSQTAATDSLADFNNAGTTVARIWSSARLLLQSQAANQSPGLHVKAGSGGEFLLRTAGGSGELVQWFSNNTTITNWAFGGCPATNCAMWFGPGSATSEAASEFILYKGTSGPAAKFNVPVRHAQYALPTCAAGTVNTEAWDTLAGGTSGSRSRKCGCTSDGGGTPAYAWQNLVSGTVGTTTTCPD